jgi:NADH-quinone oxidoreductase subunit N
MTTLIAIIGLGVLCLVFEIFNARKIIVPATIIGLLAIFGLNATQFNTPASFYNNMIVTNNFSVAFTGLFILLTIFFDEQSSQNSISVYF